jgi:hypothetical protein
MIAHPSLILLATSTNTNVRAELLGGERPDVIHSCNDDNSKLLVTSAPSPMVNPNKLIGCPLHMDEQPDG